MASTRLQSLWTDWPLGIQTHDFTLEHYDANRLNITDQTFNRYGRQEISWLLGNLQTATLLFVKLMYTIISVMNQGEIESGNQNITQSPVIGSCRVEQKQGST